MHIQEGTNTTLTTCTKMTEEVDRRHGVNGNSSGKPVSEDAPVHNSSPNATGGRLKFFKDGKFILELVRGVAREGGGGGGWVSVPRKTFWPPAGAPGTPPAAPPPSAALSVSDDNSSVQSSPWQRDHCWKQAAPRKNLSKELALYYCRPSTLSNAAIDAVGRVARRRPFEPIDAAPRRANGLRNGDAEPRADDADADADREVHYHMKLKKPHRYRKLRVYRKTRPPLRRRLLARTLARLAERAPAAPVNAKLAHCRHEHAIVSPRKRILRELERVSLEEPGKRRARTAPALSTASYPASPGPSHGPAPAPPAPPAPRPPPRHVGSYSIHSLLSMDEPATSPLPRAAESPSGASPAASPSPDGYRYRPAPAPAPGARPLAPAPGYARWGGSRARDEWAREVPYVYGYGYVPHVFRAPAPLWMQYAVPPAPSPWAPLPLPLLTDHIPKDEPTSDLPLNLSKH